MASDTPYQRRLYFDVPRALYPARHQKAADFETTWLWFVRNDNDYQDWKRSTLSWADQAGCG